MISISSLPRVEKMLIDERTMHLGSIASQAVIITAVYMTSASPKPQQNENPKYAMRTWLLRLGFIGDEFKTARDILTRRLAGDTAFRNGRAA